MGARGEEPPLRSAAPAVQATSPHGSAEAQLGLASRARSDPVGGGASIPLVEAPCLIPVGDRELAVLETYLGQALDDLLGTALN
jgi:hypothetical protein